MELSFLELEMSLDDTGKIMAWKVSQNTTVDRLDQTFQSCEALRDHSSVTFWITTDVF